MKSKNVIVIGAIILLALFLFKGKTNFLGAISTDPFLYVNLPSSVQPNQPFTVTYSTVNAPSGKWFVAWESTITGCTPSPYRDSMSSEIGGNKQISATFIAPSSGSCTFNGYFQFANFGKQYWSSQTVLVTQLCTPSWSCGSWSSCTNNIQTRTCTDTNSCGVTTGKPVESQSCTPPVILCTYHTYQCEGQGILYWCENPTVGWIKITKCSGWYAEGNIQLYDDVCISSSGTIMSQVCKPKTSCNTNADTNCDAVVSFDEIVAYASKWKNGQISFEELITSATIWVRG